MLDAKGKDGSFFDDRAIEPYGVKLMGGYSFASQSEKGTGYVSPGHNSVFYDGKTKRSYLIFHTRFPNRGEEHEVRVHRLYMNKDGWPLQRRTAMRENRIHTYRRPPHPEPTNSSSTEKTLQLRSKPQKPSGLTTTAPFPGK